MVTVIGGGIAGTVLAGALARHGHPVTVYERQSGAGGGAFLVLDGHAHEVLDRLGVPGADLHAASYPVRELRFHHLPEGRRVADGHGQRLYRRTELMRVLSEFAAAADIRYDTPVTRLDPETGALFSGAREISGPGLVLAADGTDSLARRRLEPERAARYAGQIIVYGTATRPVQLPTEPETMHFDGVPGPGPLPLATFGQHWSGATASWFVRLTRDPIPQQDNGTHPTARWSDVLRQAAPRLSDTLDALLAATDQVHVSNTRIVPFADAAPPAAPVILCGDADHAITPAAARGAREAIDDAAALITALTTGADPAAAMARRRVEITAEREQSQRRFAPPRR
ncbi:NAD(P)/FAD-dependent oxidoreductase [Nocardia sp. NPDC048505]|uniref:FAD-dependent oxidoreductase n=1 Tax=unclassified Nocardia TaxID=2637762 RepID=UPI0033E4331E